MKKIYTYISMLMLLLATACQQDELVSSPTLQPDEYQFTVTIPEPVVASRALGDQPQDVMQMPMRVLVFDENGFFIANQVATVNSFEGNQGTYTVNLPKSDADVSLHFVLGDVTFGTYSPAANEVSIFSNLTVKDGVDAYWGHLTVKDGITSNTVLKTVKLVRNFAKISVTKGEGRNEDFTLLGYALVNETNEGTVAPYTGSRFATFEGLDTADDVYATFRENNERYPGVTCGEIDESAPEADEFTPEPKYVYERNQDDSDAPVYILVKANFNEATCYYKLDIVSSDATTGVTSYLNLYRNFAYHVIIGNVESKGYDNIEEAMNAAASNNISASVEVSEVNRIEDNVERELSVDKLHIMLVSTDAYTLNYNYTIKGEPANDHVNAVPVDGDDEGGYNHEAVQKIRCNEDGTITIIPADPLPASMQTQEFIVISDEGLSRRVTVNVRTPFEFTASCIPLIDAEAGTPQTVMLQLPENLPQSVFPLEFYIEPIKKTIYPDVEKNRLPVRLHENSSFDYVATITQEQYEASRTFEFHFLSNIAESATQIKVSSDLFAEHELLSFINPSISNISLKLTDGTSVGSIDGQGAAGYVPYEAGTTVILEFDAPGDESFTLDMDYLEWVEDSRNTGSCRATNNGYTYTPNSGTAHHVLVFKTKYDIVSETIRVESNSCNPVSISYSNEPRSYDLTLKYGDGENISWGQEVTIKVGTKTNEVRTERNGKVSINLDDYIGSNLDAKVTFEYVRSFIVWSTTYSYSTTLGELRDNATYTLTER